jgi:hypothetical protein
MNIDAKSISGNIDGDMTPIGKRSIGIVSMVKSIFNETRKIGGKILDSFTASVGKKLPEAAEVITSVRSEISSFSKAHPCAAVAVGAIVVAGFIVVCAKTSIGPILALAAASACVHVVEKIKKCAKDAISDIAGDVTNDIKEMFPKEEGIFPVNEVKEGIDELQKVVSDEASKAVDKVADKVIKAVDKVIDKVINAVVVKVGSKPLKLAV